MRYDSLEFHVVRIIIFCEWFVRLDSLILSINRLLMEYCGNLEFLFGRCN